jgi:hypothetical protein
MAIKGLYECDYCGSTFVKQKTFDNHKCQSMKKHELVESMLGQRAWFFYQRWLKIQNKPVNNIKTFINSRFFNTFILFSKFVSRMPLPDTTMFINLMVEKNIPPFMWYDNNVYLLYIEHFDKKSTPEKNIIITINSLLSLSEKYNCELSEIFDVVDSYEILELFRYRKLSPWVMLNSIRFKQFYVNKLNGEQRIILESIIKLDHWSEKFKNNPDILAHIKEYVSEMKL